MFACEHELVQPDIYVFAKGLTGGYLPLAITLVSREVFSPFANGTDAATTLSYGHSYTGNALACAAARASLDIFRSENVLASLPAKSRLIREGLSALADLEGVEEVRSIGMIGAIDLTDAVSASNVCWQARGYGLLTRPIRNTIVLMPPLCITAEQLDIALSALKQAIQSVITLKQKNSQMVAKV